MTSDQLKQPFEIYYTHVGTFFPNTPPKDMVQVLWNCGEHAVFNQELRELLKINRHSATKFIHKLCRAGLVQHSELGENGGAVELTDHGRKVLRDMELAMAAIAATTPMQENSSSELRQPEESNSGKPSNSSSPIRLDELEARLGALISKLGAQPGWPVRRTEIRTAAQASSNACVKAPPSSGCRHGPAVAIGLGQFRSVASVPRLGFGTFSGKPSPILVTILFDPNRRGCLVPEELASVRARRCKVGSITAAK